MHRQRFGGRGTKSGAKQIYSALILCCAAGHSGAQHITMGNSETENNMNVKQRYLLTRLATVNRSRVSIHVTNFLARARGVVVP